MSAYFFVNSSATRRRLAAVCAVLFPVGSQALEITWDGNAKLAEEYNTNLFLNAGPHSDAWGQGIDGGLNLSFADQHWDSHLGANFNNRVYVNDGSLDYYNQLFAMKNQYFTERSRFGLDAQYNLDSTLTTQADQAANFGFAFLRLPKTTRVLSPNWLYNLSEKTQLNLGYTYQDTAYKKTHTTATFPDSVAHTGSLGLTHQWNERLQLTGSAFYTDYALTNAGRSVSQRVPTFFGPFFLGNLPGSVHSPSVTSTIITSGLTGGFNYQLTETFDISASLGGQYNETASPAFTRTTTTLPGTHGLPQSVQAQSNNTLAEVYSAKASKHFETSDLSLDYSRTISPNLQGSLITYETYAFNAQHKLTPKLSTSLSLSYSDRTFPSQAGQTNASSNYATASSSLNWQLDENWLISGSYQYAKLNYTGSQLSADAHSVFFSINYLFDKQQR